PSRSRRHGSTPPARLHSFPTRRSSDLEEWYAARERYQSLLVAVAERLAAIDESLGQYTEGILWLQRLLDETQPDERLYRAFIRLDRKSTRLNSSHVKISYAVFCLKKQT